MSASLTISSRWLAVLACACIGTDRSTPPQVGVPLPCLQQNDLPRLGKLSDIHRAAELAAALSEENPSSIVRKACDPTTTRLELGYVLFSLASLKADSDRAEAASIHDWNATQLGNPASAATLATWWLTTSTGRPSDPIKASGFAAAADEIRQRIQNDVGRGPATDGMTVRLLKMNALHPHQTLLAARKNEVDHLRTAVVTAFEHSVEP